MFEISLATGPGTLDKWFSVSIKGFGTFFANVIIIDGNRPAKTVEHYNGSSNMDFILLL